MQLKYPNPLVSYNINDNKHFIRYIVLNDMYVLWSAKWNWRRYIEIVGEKFESEIDRIKSNLIKSYRNLSIFFAGSTIRSAHQTLPPAVPFLRQCLPSSVFPAPLHPASPSPLSPPRLLFKSSVPLVLLILIILLMILNKFHCFYSASPSVSQTEPIILWTIKSQVEII